MIQTENMWLSLPLFCFLVLVALAGFAYFLARNAPMEESDVDEANVKRLLRPLRDDPDLRMATEEWMDDNWPVGGEDD